MKITLSGPDHDGRRQLVAAGHTPWRVTQHDLNDLESVLAQVKAMSKHCDAETGEHTCIMPPGHWIFPHICRACPHEWVTTDLSERRPARRDEIQPAEVTGE